MKAKILFIFLSTAFSAQVFAINVQKMLIKSVSSIDVIDLASKNNHFRKAAAATTTLNGQLTKLIRNGCNEPSLQKARFIGRLLRGIIVLKSESAGDRSQLGQSAASTLISLVKSSECWQTYNVQNYILFGEVINLFNPNRPNDVEFGNDPVNGPSNGITIYNLGNTDLHYQSLEILYSDGTIVNQTGGFTVRAGSFKNIKFSQGVISSVTIRRGRVDDDFNLVSDVLIYGTDF